MEETRIINPESGGEKGQKLARFDLIPTDSLWQLAEHYGAGAAKYADRNWERGYDWSLSYAALQRHLNAFWGGENMDDELGTPHLAAAAFHVFALLHYQLNGEQYDRFDNRPNAPTEDADFTKEGIEGLRALLASPRRSSDWERLNRPEWETS